MDLLNSECGMNMLTWKCWSETRTEKYRKKVLTRKSRMEKLTWKYGMATQTEESGWEVLTEDCRLWTS